MHLRQLMMMSAPCRRACLKRVIRAVRTPPLFPGQLPLHPLGGFSFSRWWAASTSAPLPPAPPAPSSRSRWARRRRRTPRSRGAWRPSPSSRRRCRCAAACSRCAGQAPRRELRLYCVHVCTSGCGRRGGGKGCPGGRALGRPNCREGLRPAAPHVGTRGALWRGAASPPPQRARPAPSMRMVSLCARGLVPVPGGWSRVAPQGAQKAPKGASSYLLEGRNPSHTLWDRFARRASRRVRHACSEVGAPHVTLHVGYLCACGTAARAHWWDTPDGAPRAAH